MGGDIDSLPFLQATLLVHLHDAANAKDPFHVKDNYLHAFKHITYM